MKKKRVLALVLSVCMLATSVPAWASSTDESAASSETEDVTAETEDAEEESTDDADAEDADVSEDGTEEDAADTDAAAADEDVDESDAVSLTLDTESYAEVKDVYENLGYRSAGSDVEIPLSVDDAVGARKLQYETVDGVKGINFSNDASCEYVEWTFDVEKAGLYEIVINYYAQPAYGMQIQRKLMIDGEVPFDEANTMYLYRRFREAGEVTTNAINDEVWPEMEEINTWIETPLYDYSGYFEDPLQFYFEEGEHTIRFEYIDQGILLGDIKLTGLTEYESYSDVQHSYNENGYESPDVDSITFEAEDTLYMNNSTLKRDTDTDPMTSPSSPVDRKLNITGGERWDEGNQSITWEFEVPEDGLYTINMRALQNYDSGMPSMRQIYIDDEIPFEELKNYLFEYKEKWAAYTLSDDNGAAYEFYLTEGRHTITMTVKSGLMYEVIRKTNEIVEDVSALYLKITKITTTDPDSNYEYDIAKTLPELEGKSGEFAQIAKKIEECADIMSDLTNMQTSMESSYREMASTMNEFAEDPDLVTSNLSDLEDAQTNLGTYITSMGENPLAIDYFVIQPADADEFTVKSSNFFQRLSASVQNFLASFTKNYDAVGSIYSGEGADVILDVWMARGREWGEVLKSLIDESFTSNTGIGINLNILPSGQLNAGNVSALMLSITSGTAPDAAIGVSYSDPVEFAFREAVTDLTQFEDFEEYKEQFYDTMFIPYEYEKDDHVGIYAIPETMDFTVMMVRTDIMESLNLEIPRTWDDLFHTTLPVLYENNMSFSFPVDTTASSNSPSSLKGMTMFLIQQGGSYYTDDGMYSGLDSAEAYNAFKQWTDLYVSYGLDAESSFFTRFRTGTLPIGVGAYNSYMQILTQAPELYGRWAIAPMIGTGTGEYDEDGEEIVDNRVGGISLTACQIMSSSEHEEEAWEFIKWWMDKDTQIEFGQEIEATMGISARWNSANVTAFESLPWDQGDLEIIKDQMSKAEEQPIVLGGYFTTRHLVNAWNRVYLSNENPRDALEEAVKDINSEIRKKHEEYGFVYDD